VLSARINPKLVLTILGAIYFGRHWDFIFILVFHNYFFPKWPTFSQNVRFLFLALIYLIYDIFLKITGVEVSLYQIIRSDIFFWLALYLALNFDKFRSFYTPRRIEKISYFVINFVKVAAVLVALEYLTNQPIAPAVIRVEGENFVRIYVFGLLSFFPFIFFAIHKKDFLFILSLGFIVFSTQGKIMISLFFLTILLANLQKINFGNLLIIVFFSYLAFPFLVNRFSTFLDEGDVTRLYQFEQAVKSWSGSNATRFLGVGQGTAFTEGYGEFSQVFDENERLAENSKYDIENLYGYLLIRFGILGMLLIFIFTRKVFRSMYALIYFVLVVLLYGFGSSLFNYPAGVIFVLSALIFDQYMFVKSDPHVSKIS
jgi:hypothetical protein